MTQDGSAIFALAMTSSKAAGWLPAVLATREDAGGGLTLVQISVESHIAETYTSPGQYVRVRARGAEGFFVLANEPKAPVWDLILRPGGGASDVLLAAALGDPLESTTALGSGFPMERVYGRPLVVALGGTGMAAGRPIVRRRVREGDATLTRVFVGARTRKELPMRSDLVAWAGEGVHVVACLSQDDGSVDDVHYAHGYVQDVLRAHARSGGMPGDAHIFAVGASSMVHALRELAPELAMKPDQVLTNH